LGVQTSMDIPKHYAKVSRGFWSVFDKDLPPAVEKTLPIASDRYYESVHFAQLALSLTPNENHAAEMNWYFSAHSAAYIGVFDAAKYDLKRAHSHAQFGDTPLYKEMTATSKTADLLYKDPVNASQLYCALRNLRVHFGRAMAVLEVRPLASHEPHWYAQNLDPSAYRLLRRASLSDDELNRYNGYLQMETVMDIFGRMLSIIRENIVETASFVTDKPKP
jgi:hypothetical protein